jgi:outer membrane protein
LPRHRLRRAKRRIGGTGNAIPKFLGDRTKESGGAVDGVDAIDILAIDRDQLFPTISALGAIGDTPVRDSRLSSWYGAVGANLQIPIFNGFLFTAKTHEADLRAQAEKQRILDLRNRISRDVRTSWLDASTAYQRLSVSRQLLDQANQALDLSQTRYKLGLGSIVELSQAQLQQTQAEISNVQAGYGYRLALSVLRYQTSGL